MRQSIRKTIFYCFVIAVLMVLVFNFNTKPGFVNEINPMYGSSFSLTQLTEENELQTIDFTIDKKGHFYKEVQNGRYQGDFEAWDGLNFYRYIKEYNHLLIFSNKPGEVVISHMFFSERANSQINTDLKNNTLENTSFFGFGQTFSKEISKAGETIVETIEFDNEINNPKMYKKEINEETIEYYEIKDVSDYNDVLDIPTLINLEKLKNSGTIITTAGN